MRRVTIVVVPLALLVALGVLMARQRGGGGTQHQESPAPQAPVAQPPPIDPVPARPGGALRVTVTAGEQPIAEVIVELFDPSTHARLTGKTDAGGEARFDGLRAGGWTVRARYRTHVPVTARAIVASGETAEVSLRVEPGGRAQGTVTDAAGQPVAGAEVAVLDPQRRVELDRALTVQTDAAGAYAIDGIPLREIGIGVRAKRFKPAEKFGFRFSTPDERQEINFTLEAGTTVAGRVIDEGGMPIENATVTAGNEFGGGTRTDAEGRFAVHGLGDKPVGLSASKPGFGTAFVRNVMPNDQNVEIRLFRGARLEGRLLAPRPLESFSVLLYRWEEELQRNLLVRTKRFDRTNGLFDLADVAPGTYLVSVDAPGFEAAGPEELEIDITIRPGETRKSVVRGLRLAVQPGQHVRDVTLEARERTP